jgi:hypothetical protein
MVILRATEPTDKYANGKFLVRERRWFLVDGSSYTTTFGASMMIVLFLGKRQDSNHAPYRNFLVYYIEISMIAVYIKRRDASLSIVDMMSTFNIY